MPFLGGMKHQTANIAAMVNGVVRVGVAKDRVEFCAFKFLS